MPPPAVLPHNPDMTLAPGAPEAVLVFTVDEDGEREQLGTGTRVADDVVLVQGRLAARLAEAKGKSTPPPLLRVALPAPDGSDEPTFVEVETVHVAEPGKVAQFHELIGTNSDTTVVALELVAGPEVVAFRSAPLVAGRGPGDDPPVLMSTNVLCLVFGRLLRICRP